MNVNFKGKNIPVALL